MMSSSRARFFTPLSLFAIGRPSRARGFGAARLRVNSYRHACKMMRPDRHSERRSRAPTLLISRALCWLRNISPSVRLRQGRLDVSIRRRGETTIIRRRCISFVDSPRRAAFRQDITARHAYRLMSPAPRMLSAHRTTKCYLFRYAS